MTDKNSTSFWGKGIAIAVTLFIGSTLGVVAFLMSLDFQMVTDHHYEKAVHYQDQINRIEHASTMAEPVTIQNMPKSHEIWIHFPKSDIDNALTGSVELYRPSNSSLDQEMEFKLDKGGILKINSQNLAKGKWLIQVNWQAEGKRYFKEETVFVQ